jgi:hypothetical protein
LLAMASSQPIDIFLMYPDQTVGAGLLAMGAWQAVDFKLVYISIPAVTASMGFALTASHFEKRNAARRKVTKRSCPFRTVPRLGSAYPRSGPAP